MKLHEWLPAEIVQARQPENRDVWVYGATAKCKNCHQLIAIERSLSRRSIAILKLDTIYLHLVLQCLEFDAQSDLNYFVSLDLYTYECHGDKNETPVEGPIQDSDKREP